MTPAASAPPPTTPEVLPVPLGYQSPLPPRRPGARPWAAATALAAGLVLLGIALYALLSLASALTAAGSRAYSRDVWEILPPMFGVFAGICTAAALLFLPVGLRWLARVSRSAD
jgi:hypothetical protein